MKGFFSGLLVAFALAHQSEVEQEAETIKGITTEKFFSEIIDANSTGYGTLIDKTKVNFLFFSMQKCGACEETKPDWVDLMSRDTYPELQTIYIDCTD